MATKAAVKLNYFTVRSRGEPIRMLLKYTKRSFTSNNVTFDDWMADTDKVRTERFLCGREKGSLPVLTLADGTDVPDSLAIAQWIAKESAETHPWLAGSSPEDVEALWHSVDLDPPPYGGENGFYGRIDPILNFFPAEDTAAMIGPYLSEAPALLQWLESKLAGKKFFGGNSGPSIADFQICHCLNNLCTLDGGASLKKSSAIGDWYESMVVGIPEVAEYLKERPKAGSKEVGVKGSLIYSNAVVSETKEVKAAMGAAAAPM